MTCMPHCLSCLKSQVSFRVISLIPHYKLLSVILRGFVSLEYSINWLYGNFSNKYHHISSPLHNVLHIELSFQYQYIIMVLNSFFIISQ